MLVEPKYVMNDVYQSALALGVASALNMALVKFARISMGTPMSLKPFVMLSIALGLGHAVLKVLEEIYKIPTEPFKTS